MRQIFAMFCSKRKALYNWGLFFSSKIDKMVGLDKKRRLAK